MPSRPGNDRTTSKLWVLDLVSSSRAIEEKSVFPWRTIDYGGFFIPKVLTRSCKKVVHFVVILVTQKAVIISSCFLSDFKSVGCEYLHAFHLETSCCMIRNFKISYLRFHHVFRIISGSILLGVRSTLHHVSFSFDSRVTFSLSKKD